ncbi:hypothetical protein R1flu_016483 [Riccia fluitans]|uniref:KIB1-4 beta-propeller domain-containing protein n=1 Tax=Riccia fluitans TaxID=41844 RepID=A0ABD1YQ22_9MARC
MSMERQPSPPDPAMSKATTSTTTTEKVIMKMTTMRINEQEDNDNKNRNRESYPKSNDEEGFVMSGRYIPKEVMCTILARLPERAFVGVCRSWYKLVKDVEFQITKQRIRALTQAPFLLWDSIHVDQPYAYDILLRRWFPFPVTVFRRVTHDSPFQVHSSCGGLFLIKHDVNGVRTFSTMNPLTRSQRLLPPMLDKPMNFHVLQMVMDDEVDRRFLIIAEGCDQYVTDPNTPKIQIYDSVRNSWQMAGGLRPPRPRDHRRDSLDERLIFRGAAIVKGALYCLAVTSRTAHVLKFDGMDQWHEIGAKLPSCIIPQAMGSSALINAVMWTPHLFENRGRLMLVGAEFRKYHQRCRPRYGVDELVNLWRQDSFERGANDVDEGVHVWGLDEERMKWVQLHTMPHELFDHSVKYYEFRTSGDYLHVSPWPRTEKMEMFVSNLATRCWELIKEPPFSGDQVVKPHSLLQKHTLYEPRVAALA